MCGTFFAISQGFVKYSSALKNSLWCVNYKKKVDSNAMVVEIFNIIVATLNLLRGLFQLHYSNKEMQINSFFFSISISHTHKHNQKNQV